MTQTAVILAALQRGESITTLEASDKYRICRLSERVRELERMGYRIDHKPERLNGKRWVRYSLVGEAA